MKNTLQAIKEQIITPIKQTKKYIAQHKIGFFGTCMLVLLLGIFTTTTLQQTFAANIDDGFIISEYIEGSSNNKAIELYNGSNFDINLSGYKLLWYNNGFSTPGAPLILSGILTKGSTFVIVNNQATVDLKNRADLITNSPVLTFNGDDAISLARSNDTHVDVFGQTGSDPGSAWTAGGVTTVNKTLVRKPTVRIGDAIGNNVFNPSIERIQYNEDTFTNLGSHTMDVIEPVDTTPPIATINLASGQSSLTTFLTGKFLVTFSEAINTSTFACDDITFAGTAAGMCTNINQISPNNGTRFEVTTTASNTGTIIINIGTGKLTDITGNPNGTTIIVGNTITIDEEPIATIDLANGQSSSGTSLTGKFLVTFSEAINTSSFTCSDIDLSGTAAGKSCVSIQQIAPNDGTTFEVITSVSNDGTIIINIGTGKLTDTIGTANGTTIINQNIITIDRSSLWLSPGDIVIVTANGSPDFFEFLVRKALDPGTVIYFSDNAWKSDNTRGTTEGTLIFTSSTTIPAGTIISVKGMEATPSLIQNTLGTIQKYSNFDIAVAGDNILVYQGDSPSTTTPIFIHGFGFFSTNPRINNGIPTANNSYLPTSLTLGVNAINYDMNYRNSQYNCVNTAMSSPSFVADIHNKTNWTGNAITTIDGNYPPISCIFHNNTIPTYILMYEAGTGGSLSGDDLQEIDEGENGTAVEAIANTGYYFVQRSDGSTTNPRTDVNVNSDIEVIAEFTATLLLIYDVDSNGSLSGNILQEIRGGEVGTPVEAIADPGYHFTQRSDGITNNPRTDHEDTYVTAYFIQDAAITYTLTYLAGSNGTISGTSSQIIEEHTDGHLVEAIANPGYHFTQRSDGITTSQRTDTNITGNMSVTAQFEANPIITYTLSYSTDSNGSLNGTTSQTIIEGEDGTPVEAIANPGYHFVQRSDGITNNPRTDTNVHGNISVIALLVIDEEETPDVPNNGGGTRLEKDNCPNGDNSPSYYDTICEMDTGHQSAPVYPISYYLNRKNLALLINIVSKQKTIGHKSAEDDPCEFSDIAGLSNHEQTTIKEVCANHLMGRAQDGIKKSKKFNPYAKVSYYEVVTVLSRLLYGGTYNIPLYSDTPWYSNHLKNIEKLGILDGSTNITAQSIITLLTKTYTSFDVIQKQ